MDLAINHLLVGKRDAVLRLPQEDAALPALLADPLAAHHAEGVRLVFHHENRLLDHLVHHLAFQFVMETVG